MGFSTRWKPAQGSRLPKCKRAIKPARRSNSHSAAVRRRRSLSVDERTTSLGTVPTTRAAARFRPHSGEWSPNKALARTHRTTRAKAFELPDWRASVPSGRTQEGKAEMGRFLGIALGATDTPTARAAGGTIPVRSYDGEQARAQGDSACRGHRRSRAVFRNPKGMESQRRSPYAALQGRSIMRTFFHCLLMAVLPCGAMDSRGQLAKREE